MPKSTADHRKLTILVPAFLIAAVALWGLVTGSLVYLQAATLVTTLYGMFVFTVGAIAYRGRPAASAPPITEAEWPLVSIMIPAHNEEAVIANTIAHMLKLDYPRFEVIVIDDHSKDRTGEIARTYPIKVVSRRNMPNRGKSEALNAGFEVAEGDVICVFDADSEVAPDFLRLAVAPLVLDPEVGGVQAQVRIYNRKQNFLTRGQDDEFALFSEITQMGRHTLALASALGGNGQLTRRSVIKAVGGWSPAALTEDLDLTIRMFLAGRGRVAHVSEAVVWQEGVATLGALVRQRTRWAEGMLRCFGEFAWPIMRRPGLPLRIRLDALYVLLSVFIPMLTLTGLVYSTALFVQPGFFKASLPPAAVSVIALSALSFLCSWSLVISYKRDRRLDPLPGLRSLVYLLHWVPAMVLAIGRVARNRPVVWEKTEHIGQRLTTTLTAEAREPLAQPTT